MTSAPPGGPLTGLRVVDLSSTFMGPYCTMLLGQWGADVVKVEPPAGDLVRYIGDHHGTGMGPVFLNTNRGKRSVVLDLKHPGARQVLDRLIGCGDIFVHNMRPAAAIRAGLSGDEILRRNPRCLLLAFRGFAAGGRRRRNPPTMTSSRPGADWLPCRAGRVRRPTCAARSRTRSSARSVPQPCSRH